MDMSRAERILLERDRAAEAAKKREEKRQEEPDPEEDPPKEQPEAEPEPRKRQVKNRKKKHPTSHTFLARSFNEIRGGWEEAVRVKKVLFREPPHYTKRRPVRTSGEVRSTWAVNTAEH